MNQLLIYKPAEIGIYRIYFRAPRQAVQLGGLVVRGPRIVLRDSFGCYLIGSFKVIVWQSIVNPLNPMF